MTKTEIELFNKCSNLEAENERLNLQLKSYEENVTRIITHFWCWYVSGNHIRDMSAKEEGKKYANNFFHDLIQEAEEMKNEEWFVILNMNCKYEICRMCPKSGLFKGSYEECEKWIEQKELEK